LRIADGIDGDEGEREILVLIGDLDDAAGDFVGNFGINGFFVGFAAHGSILRRREDGEDAGRLGRVGGVFRAERAVRIRVIIDLPENVFADAVDIPNEPKSCSPCGSLSSVNLSKRRTISQIDTCVSDGSDRTPRVATTKPGTGGLRMQPC
jgi:hypothetical protein